MEENHLGNAGVLFNPRWIYTEFHDRLTLQQAREMEARLMLKWGIEHPGQVENGKA